MPSSRPAERPLAGGSHVAERPEADIRSGGPGACKQTFVLSIIGRSLATPIQHLACHFKR